jgi:polysaccharide chain length determinant protein (PEP-CTERM system associated)
MSGELTTNREMVQILLIEAQRRRVSLGLMFAVVALAALVLGTYWPKKYASSTTILVQESSIIKPLMEGRAVPTGIADRASIAREVIFSRKIMDEVLTVGGWMNDKPTPIEQERIVDAVKNRTTIGSQRDNLIQIGYSDSDPDRSYNVVTLLARRFIEESLAAKERESREAYEFISGQVEEYHKKLTDAEDKLKVFRGKNADARPGSATDSNTRIGDLRNQVENARMEMMEQRSREGSLAAQLNGESEVVATQTREGQQRVRMNELQTELDKLLLTYTDKHPDVVRLRHQIEDVREQLRDEQKQGDLRKAAGIAAPLSESSLSNPLYMELRSKLAEARRNGAAAQSRMDSSQSLLNAELDRGRRIADSENSLAELTRDYEVNRDIYQDLLKRRENARVSMNLDADHQGLTFTIQEPAVKPLQPVGLRFMHFGLAGLAAGATLPLLLLFALARFDTRMRSAEQLERLTGVPILATIPVYETVKDKYRSRWRTLTLVLIVFGVFFAYALVISMHLRAL